MVNDGKSRLSCGPCKSVLMLVIAGLAMAAPARAQEVPPTTMRLRLATALEFAVKLGREEEVVAW